MIAVFVSEITCVMLLCDSALSEKSRHEMELNIAQLQQQLDSVTQRSQHREQQLQLALHHEKQSHETDLRRLTADKVIIIIIITPLSQ